MGVCVKAYSDLTLLPPHPLDDNCFDDEPYHLLAMAYTGFERSYEGLAVEDGNFPEGIGGRCYIRTETTETFLVGDWSYSGYNAWRTWLCRSVHGVEPRVVWKNLDQYRYKPFYDLINFADNEGTIGPVAAARLVTAFRDHMPTTEPPFSDYLAGAHSFAAGAEVATRNGMIRYS